ncbi:general substrate transporter [Calocera cornea HHB12733]|uniref:General substrate transporter n=1 Tax=Calocera cornea HHB12733 TaxID=1353952 RepID=A0A165IWD3_9BASI|nr:general substrate transporter [Calocera cornea HHB12733]
MASQQVFDPELEKDASLSDSKEEVKHVERSLPHGHEIHVKNARFANAKLHTTLKVNSKEGFVLFLCMFTCFLTSAVSGYDGTLMTSINGMPYWIATVNAGQPAVGTGLIFSMYTIGQIVAPVFAGPFTDYFGRKWGVMSGCLIICVGTAIISSSFGQSQFVGGRFLLGFGASVISVAAPAYCVEVAPPQWRGRMMGLFNTGWYSGSIPAAGITLGTRTIQSDWSWRIPLILQGLPALIVCFIILFLPESPRWLMAQGKDEQALAFLVKYHGSGNPEDPIVMLEYDEFKESIMINASDKRFWDWSELWDTANARWRSLMVIFMGVAGQFSGSGLSYFNLQLYSQLGFNTTQQFDFNLGNQFMSCTGSTIGTSLADKLPRRKALIGGTFGCAMMLVCAGAFSELVAKGKANPNMERAGVACYFMFHIISGFTFTPLQPTYPSEVLKTNTRAKGMALYSVVCGAFSFINTFAGPIALANITYNYIYFFVGWDLFECIIWYFFGVETLGRTIEELDEIFSAPNPVKASIANRDVIVDDVHEKV